MLNFRLTPGQLELQRKSREFSLREILPVAWYYDEKDETPIPVLKKAYEAGLMNGAVPKEYGGKGYGSVECAILTEEIAAACAGLATSIFDNSLGLEPLILSNNEPLKMKYFEKVLSDFKLICFATSEPTMGSDVAGIRCLAKEDGDSYVLNGTKYWVTNGGIADYMTIFATVDPESRHEGICAFVIEKNWDGISVSPRIPKMGQRCSNTAGINFNNVRVPKENMLAPPGEGFVLAMKTFSRTRPIIGAFAVGVARSAMEFAMDYAKKRRAFESKIINFQAIQNKIAEMYQKVETSRLLVWKAAWEVDNDMDPTLSASMAKLYSSEETLSVVNEALQIFGGYGYTKMYPIEKLLRDMRLFKIYEGTSEIQRMIISDYALNAYNPVMPPLEDMPMHREKDLSIPASEAGEETSAWRCRICGHIHYGDEPPEECPYCFFPKTSFKKIETPEF